MTTNRSRATQGRSGIVVFALFYLLPILAPASLHAQVAVFPVQNLTFGTIRAGCPSKSGRTTSPPAPSWSSWAPGGS